jgi:hypothetical protein
MESVHLPMTESCLVVAVAGALDRLPFRNAENSSQSEVQMYNLNSSVVFNLLTNEGDKGRGGKS